MDVLALLGKSNPGSILGKMEKDGRCKALLLWIRTMRLSWSKTALTKGRALQLSISEANWIPNETKLRLRMTR
eukprot:5754448-Amphidinium_carterae.1